MVSARLAAYAQPATENDENTRPRRSRRLPVALAMLMGLTVAIPAVFVVAPPAPVIAGSGCSGWTSLTRPPDNIRVLRVKSGGIDVVPFRRYVATVMGLEWPSYLPQAVVEAGAVATKQYAWYHAVYSSRSTANGRCYDVKDSTGDQLYKPRRARIRADHYRAIDATWSVSLRKNERFFMTGYRRGEAVGCGRDATGWKLFARSAIRCAQHGYGWRRILDTYYSPALAFNDGDGGSSAPSSLTTVSSGRAFSTMTPVNETADRTADDANAAPTDDQAAVLADSAVLVGDRSRSISWGGSWRRTRSITADGSRISYLGSGGSSATFRFVGRALELMGTRGPSRGWIEVYIDGQHVATVDLFAAASGSSVSIFKQDWQSASARTVLIRVIGTAERPRVDLGAIVIGP